jgi:hypothetical protein
VDADFVSSFDYALPAPLLPDTPAGPAEVVLNERVYTAFRSFPSQEVIFHGYTVKPDSHLSFSCYVPWRFREAVEDPHFRVDIWRSNGETETIAEAKPLPYVEHPRIGEPIERRVVPLDTYAGETVSFVFRYTIDAGNDICHGLWVDPKVLTWGPEAGAPLTTTPAETMKTAVLPAG